MKEIDVSLIENGQLREFIALPNHVRPLRGRFVLLIIFSTDMRPFQGRSVNLLNRNTF